MKSHDQNAFYLLSVEGEVWAIERKRMRGYLNRFIVSEMSGADIQARTGPGPPRFHDCDEGSPLVIDCPDLGPEQIASLEAGIPYHAAVLEAALGSRRTKKAIAVLPLLGPITQRPGLFSAFFGGTSTEKWARSFDELVASSSVGAIVIDMDSPGGTVSGVPELADKIFQARGTKPIVVVANTMAASAGYWIASSADEIVVAPSGEVGSIGVWSMHVDVSAALEKLGEKVTLISAGEYKTEFNPYEPLSVEARDFEQSRVDGYYGQFVEAVARGRGVTSNTVRKRFGQGRMLAPREAVAEGMADRTATLEQTIKRLGGRVAEREQALAEHKAREEWLAEQERKLAGEDAPQAPYPNEHACRLHSPANYKKFRRGTRDHEGKKYSVIYGQKKDGGDWEDQAYRYDRETWKAEEARKHCKEHDGTFEAASGEESFGETPCDSCGKRSVGTIGTPGNEYHACTKHLQDVDLMLTEIARSKRTKAR